MGSMSSLYINPKQPGALFSSINWIAQKSSDGESSQDLDTWLRAMVNKSPIPGVAGPLPESLSLHGL